ncbi:MAG TPA: hypothetical protein VLQ48_02400 [Chloroflexia bacterium]|nr:hypothetical protein [Chloroflexia bacterium]
MNDKPEVPNPRPDSESTGETNRPETPRSQPEGTPTVNIGGSYAGTSAPDSDPYSWKPGQYTAPSNPGYSEQGQGQPTRYNPPPQYAPPPQYDPNRVPQGQTPQYMPNQMQQYGGGYPQAQQPQYAPYAVAPKDPVVGLLLELLGYLGFLGIGHIWAGKTTRGVVLLLGYWAYMAVSVVLTIVLVGCLMLVATLAIPLISGFYLKNEMEREQAAMGYRR